LKNKKTFNSGKTGNEGILRILAKTVRQAGLILLFDGEVGRVVEGYWLRVEGNAFYDFDSQLSTFNSQQLQPDEHSQTGILTSASDRLPPSRLLGGIGICSRYSGATVPDSHRVP
jgi:hypothetical protein